MYIPSDNGAQCNILGIDEAELENQWNIELSPLFEDIMGLMGVPTSTINAILADISGNVDIKERMDKFTVQVSFALGTSSDLAVAEEPIPIVFALQKASSSNYTGGTQLQATATIKYRTAVLFENPYIWPVIFTTKTQTGCVNFEVTLT